MLKRLAALELMLLLAVGLVFAQGTYTYNWTVEGNPLNRMNQDANYAQQHLRFVMPASDATGANIVASRNTSLGVVDTVSVTAGPAPQVGEYAQASGGIQPYIAEIINAVQNADGTYDITLKLFNDWGFPVRSGVEQIGPPLFYDIWLNGRNGTGPLPAESCLPAQSTVSADFLDSNGFFQTLTSDAGSVTCTTSSQKIGTITYLVTTGSFNGTASNGQVFTGVAFTFNNEGARYGWNVVSAGWN